MSRSLTIRAVRLDDVDGIERGEEPVVKFTLLPDDNAGPAVGRQLSVSCLTNAGKETGKKTNKYVFYFEKENNGQPITCDGSVQFANIRGETDVRISVSILIVDKTTNHSRVWPGVGQLVLPAADLHSTTGGKAIDVVCELQENDMPYGELRCSYNLVGDVEPSKKNNAEETKAETKETTLEMNSGNRSPGRRTVERHSDSGSDRKVIGSTDLPSRASSVRPASAKPSRIIDKTEKVAKTSRTQFKASEGNNSAETIISPPAWVKQVPLKTFGALADDLTGLDFDKLSLRLHSSMLTMRKEYADNISSGAATAKLSIDPVPGKQTILRSEVGVRSPASSRIEWSYSKKTALLSLSAADLRSRLYREGCSPSVHILVTMGGVPFEANLYIPALIKSLAARGCLFAVPLTQTDSNEDGSRAQSASLVFEVSTRKNSEPYISNTLPLTELAEQVQQAHALARGQLIKEASNVLFRPAERMMVRFNLIGIDGFAYKKQQYPFLRLECSLSASGACKTITLGGASVWDQGKNKGFSLEQVGTCDMESYWPDADLLVFALFSGKLPEDEIGSVSIPVRSLILQQTEAARLSPRPEEVVYTSVRKDEMGVRCLKGVWNLCVGTLEVKMSSRNPSAATNAIHDSMDDLSAPVKVVPAPHSSEQNDLPMIEISQRTGKNHRVLNRDASAESKVTENLTSVDRAWAQDASDKSFAANTAMLSTINSSVFKDVSGSLRAPVCSGVLVGCVYGFVANDNYFGSVAHIKQNQLRVEINLEATGSGGGKAEAGIASHPGAGVLTSSEKHDGKGYTFVEISKGNIFKMPLTWSCQQMKAPYLRLGIYYSNVDKSKWAASATLDVASLTDKSRTTALGFVPLLESDTVGKDSIKMTGKSAANSEIIGWALVAIKFSDNDGLSAWLLNRKDEADKLESCCRSAWKSVTSNVNFPLSRLDLLLGHRRSEAGSSRTESLAMSVQAKVVSNAPIRAGTIDITLQALVAPLEISTTTVEKIRQLLLPSHSGNEPGLLTLVLSLGSESTQTLVASHVQGNRLYFRDGHVMLSLTSETTSPITSMFVVLYATLAYITGTSTGSIAPKVIAESATIIPSETLHFGLPLDACVPLRDKNGNRVALMDINAHSTYFGANDGIMLSGEAPETCSIGGMHQETLTAKVSRPLGALTAILDDTDLAPHSEAKINICVSFEEGNVADSSWWAPVEPFFECNLVAPQEIANTTPVLSSRLRDRTPFLPQSGSANGKKWGLKCHLSIPANSVPNASEKESAGSVKWILAIVVRDAARLNCPEMGYARVGIPWSVFGKPNNVTETGSAITSSLDQWIDIHPPAGSVARQESAGRVYIRVNTYDEQLLIKSENATQLPGVHPDASMTGIGVVSFWLNKMSEIAAGSEDIEMNMLGASVASHITTQNKSPADNEDEISEPFAEVSVLNAGRAVMCSTVPVPGGNTEIRIKIHSTNSRLQYCTSYPTLASAPKPDESSKEGAVGMSDVAAGVPSLDLIMTDSFDQTSSQSVRKLKRAPRLKIDTAFIPFVQGSLLIAVHAVKFRGNIEGKYLAKDARSGCFRAVLGPGSFAYSESFDLNVPTPKVSRPAGSGDAQFSVKGKEQVPILARMAMPVDTLLLASGENSCASMELFLLDLDSLGDGGKGYCLGSGTVRTASLYYQAVRAAASSSLPASKVDGAESSNGNKNGAVGASPWLPVAVDIIDKNLNRIVATVVISIQFIATAVPSKVLASIDSIGLSGADSTGKKSQIELSLKQAFLLSDRDKSGSVDSVELFGTIKNAKSKGGSDDIFTAMLMSLAGFKLDNEHRDSMATLPTIKDLEQAVTKTFNRLDVDGNGSVSWWEWRRVLVVSLMDSHRVSRFLNLKDSMLLGLLAAHDAILASNASPAALCNETLAPASMDMTVAGSAVGTAAFVTIPFAKVDFSNTRATTDVGAGLTNVAPVSFQASSESEANDPLADLPADLAPAKAVPRLQNMVKSLRYQNQSLTKRLENAIVQSHRILSRERDPKAFVDANRIPVPGEETEVKLPAVEDDVRLEISRVTRRAHDAELQQQIMAKALEFEKKRNQELEFELAQAKRLTIGMKNAIKEKEQGSAFAREHLQLEIKKHAEALEDLKLTKKRKLHAAVLLTMFFRLKVLPKIRAKIRAQKENQLKHALSGAVERRKFIQEKKKREKATVTLQAMGRGFKSRKLVKKQQESALQIQKVLRGKLARKLREKMLLEKVAAMFSAEYRAASVVKRCVTRWLARYRAAQDEAAKKIQQALAKKAQRKQAQQQVSELREQKKRNKIEHHAAAQIQRHGRGYIARKLVTTLKKMAVTQREAVLQRAREVEQMRAFELAKRNERVYYNKKRKEEIKMMWEERASLVPCRKPEIKQCMGYWVARAIGTETVNRRAEYTEAQIEAAQTRFSNIDAIFNTGIVPTLTSVQLLINALEKEVRNTRMQAMAPKGTTSAGAQQELVDLMEERGNVEAHDLGDAYAYLGDILLGQSRYAEALGAFDKSFMLSDNFSTRLQPKNKVDRIKKMAFLEYLLSGSHKSLEEAVTRCEALLVAAKDIFGENSIPYAEAKVFAANIFSVARVNSTRVKKLLEDAVKLLKSKKPADILTSEAQQDLNAVTILAKLKANDEEDIETRKALVPRLAKVQSYNEDLHMLTVASNKHDAQTLEIVDEDAAPEETDNTIQNIPYDHPKLLWFATPSMVSADETEAYMSSALNASDVASRTDGPSARNNSKNDLILPSTATSVLRQSSENAKLAQQLREEIAAEGKFTEYELEEVERPPMQMCTVGYMVSFSEDGSESNERTGNVHGVDIGKRLIVVAFNDEQISGSSPRLDFLSYDHPHIHWFKDNAYLEKISIRKLAPTVAAISVLPRPKTILQSLGYLVEVPAREAASEPGDMYAGKVTSIDATKNLINIAFQDVNDKWSETDFDTLPFNSPLVAWMQAPPSAVALSATQRPTKMDDAYGYSVQIKSKDLTAKDGDMYDGTIVYINETTKRMEISFASMGNSGQSGKEEFDYNSSDVAWMAPPSPRYSMMLRSQARSRQVRDNSALKLDFSGASMTSLKKASNDSSTSQTTNDIIPRHKHSKINRPAFIDAVGYRVELESREPGARDGDMYPGRIVSISGTERNGRVKIKFDVLDGYDSDYEVVPWNSELLAWMDEPELGQGSSKGSQKHLSGLYREKDIAEKPFRHALSLVDRPTLQNSIGYGVEVQSHEPSAEIGDMFPGVVVSISLADNTMRVMFEVEEGFDPDFEILPYDSTDVAWISVPKITLNSSRAKNATPVVAPASAATVDAVGNSAQVFRHNLSLIDRPLLRDAVGYGVEVQSHDPGAEEGDMFPGTVHSVDLVSGVMRVQFAVQEGFEPDYENIPYESHDVAWMHLPAPLVSPKQLSSASPVISPTKAKSPASSPAKTPVVEFKHSLSLVDRPPFIDAVGYGVEIQSHEPGAEQGDMYPGTVVSLIEASKKLRVEFEVEAGNQPDYEDVSYESHDIAWVSKPVLKATPASSPVKAAAPTPAPTPVSKTASSISAPKFRVDDRVEGNYKASGQWYKGNITRVGQFEDGSPQYDILYDDDETEEDLEEHLVRKVEKKPMSDRLQATASATVATPTKASTTTPTKAKSPASSPAKTPVVEFKHSLSLVDRPPFIDAVGYGVEIQSHEPGAEQGDMYPGTVVSLIEASKKLRVEFEVEAGNQPDYEDVSYESHDIAWVSKPVLKATPASSPVKAAAPTPAPTPVSKTASSISAPKFRVDDRVEGNYKASGQWYKGNITRVGQFEDGSPQYDILYDDDETEEDLEEHLVRKVEKKPMSDRLQATASATVATPTKASTTTPTKAKSPASSPAKTPIVSQSLDPSEEALMSSLPNEDSQPHINLFSKTGRPPILKAVGYTVQVQSHDPGAEVGDMFSGKIIRVDPASQTMTVLFESDGSAKGVQDTETFSYLSEDVAWMASP